MWMLLSHYLFQVNNCILLHKRVCLNDGFPFISDRVCIFYSEDATSKRQLIVKEIFETEYNYISQLNTINDVSFFDCKVVGVSGSILETPPWSSLA